MKPSSIACFIEYKSNTFPNIWRVLAFGVAVKAKKLAFSGIFLASISSFNLSSISKSLSSLMSIVAETAIFKEAAARPLWEEWASSMIIAKFFPFNSVPIFSSK